MTKKDAIDFIKMTCDREDLSHYSYGDDTPVTGAEAICDIEQMDEDMWADAEIHAIDQDGGEIW